MPSPYVEIQLHNGFVQQWLAVGPQMEIQWAEAGLRLDFTTT